MGSQNHSYGEEFQGDESSGDGEQSGDERISIEQLQRLVQLLDKSDVSEIELKRANGDMRLVLRKAKADEASVSVAAPTLLSSQQSMNGMVNSLLSAGNAPQAAPVVDTLHRVTAPLVGVFHVWAKPKGGALVAVGDKVREGQLVGTIQSLNVMNEVETQFAGRVVDILVQEGQPVEYGQHLMTIDSAE